MWNTTRLSLAVLTAAIGFGLSPALHAQEAPGSVGPCVASDAGPMKMMNECSRMMQSMNNRRGADEPRSASRNTAIKVGA